MCFRGFLPLSTHFDVTSTIGVSIVRFLAFCDLKNQEFEAFSENLQSFSFWANRKIKYIFFCGWKQKQKYFKKKIFID